MATERLRIIARCLCLVTMMGASVTPTQDYAELVARLYRQAVRNNKPLVVVLDQSRPRPPLELSTSSSDEETNGLVKLLKQLQQRLRPARHEHSRYHNYDKQPRDRFRTLLQQFADKRDRYQAQPPRYQAPKYQPRYRDEDNVQGPKNVAKSLLTLRNSLSCSAQDQCKRKCVSNTLRQQTSSGALGKCVKVCEVTFTCMPAQQPQQDECANSADCQPSDSCGGGDSCGTQEVNPSTRAPPPFDSCAVDSNQC